MIINISIIHFIVIIIIIIIIIGIQPLGRSVQKPELSQAKEGVLRIFFALKNPTASAGFELGY